MSAYIWQLKSEGKNFEINWKILKHAKPFTPANGQCALCTAEKEIIIFKPEFASTKNPNYSTKNRRLRIKLRPRLREENLAV